jgi:hypothetical protein
MTAPARADRPQESRSVAAPSGVQRTSARHREDERGEHAARPLPRSLVIGCGALARELAEVVRSLPHVDVTCLRPDLHNRPERIVPAVRAEIAAARPVYGDRIFVAYADCGTGGVLDRLLAEEGIERLPGTHCYEFYAGAEAFGRLADEEPGTFYLTDFLARNFERLVWRGLGLDRHPELLPLYFGNYRRLVYLSQAAGGAALVDQARAAADRLGLAFEQRHVGLGDLATSIRVFAGAGA